MRARSENPEWVQNLRGIIRERVGSSFTVGVQAGKAKLTLRFQGGKRRVATLPFDWEKAQSLAIEDAVKEIARLIDNGKSFDEAIGAIKRTSPTAPKAANEPNPELLLQAWESFGGYKTGQSGDVDKGTWETVYKKTEKRLREISSSTTAHELLKRAGEIWEPGQRMRQQVVRQLADFLRFAVSEQGDFVLEPDRWTPPPKGGLGPYTGKKAPGKKEKTVAIEDADILELIGSLTVDHNHPVQRASARQWDLAIKLMATYGLRPIEIKHLEVRENGKKTLWCTFQKKAGGGTSKPRRLWPLHPNWESDWNLIERVENQDPLPPAKGGVGDAAGKFLARNPVWKKLKAEEPDVVPKSFRHSFAKRGHLDYEIPDTMMASYMGHTLEVHHLSYLQWSTREKTQEAAYEEALRRKQLTNKDHHV